VAEHTLRAGGRRAVGNRLSWPPSPQARPGRAWAEMWTRQGQSAMPTCATGPRGRKKLVFALSTLRLRIRSKLTRCIRQRSMSRRGSRNALPGSRHHRSPVAAGSGSPRKSPSHPREEGQRPRGDVGPMRLLRECACVE